MAEIVRDFVPRMQERIAEMKFDFEARRWTELDAHAHWLRGSAGTTGFMPIAALAGRLQAASELRDPRACNEILADIEQLASRAVQPCDHNSCAT